MGFKDAPRCLPCLSRGLGRDAGELRSQLGEYVRRRECYAAAWAEAESLDGVATMPDGWSQSHTQLNDAGDEMPDEVAWDAGAIGCGELALALRVKLAAMQKRQAESMAYVEEHFPKLHRDVLAAITDRNTALDGEVA